MGFKDASEIAAQYAQDVGGTNNAGNDFERVYGDAENISDNEICSVSHTTEKGKTTKYSVRFVIRRRLADNEPCLFVEGVNDTPGSKSRGKAAGLKSPVGRVLLGTAASIAEPAVGAKHFTDDFVAFAKTTR